MQIQKMLYYQARKKWFNVSVIHKDLEEMRFVFKRKYIKQYLHMIRHYLRYSTFQDYWHNLRHVIWIPGKIIKVFLWKKFWVYEYVLITSMYVLIDFPFPLFLFVYLNALYEWFYIKIPYYFVNITSIMFFFSNKLLFFVHSVIFTSIFITLSIFDIIFNKILYVYTMQFCFWLYNMFMYVYDVYKYIILFFEEESINLPLHFYNFSLLIVYNTKLSIYWIWHYLFIWLFCPIFSLYNKLESDNIHSLYSIYKFKLAISSLHIIQSLFDIKSIFSYIVYLSNKRIGQYNIFLTYSSVNIHFEFLLRLFYLIHKLVIDYYQKYYDLIVPVKLQFCIFEFFDNFYNKICINLEYYEYVTKKGRLTGRSRRSKRNEFWKSYFFYKNIRNWFSNGYLKNMHLTIPSNVQKYYFDRIFTIKNLRYYSKNYIYIIYLLSIWLFIFVKGHKILFNIEHNNEDVLVKYLWWKSVWQTHPSNAFWLHKGFNQKWKKMYLSIKINDFLSMVI